MLIYQAEIAIYNAEGGIPHNYVASAEVEKYLHYINIKKAHGPDNIL